MMVAPAGNGLTFHEPNLDYGYRSGMAASFYKDGKLFRCAVEIRKGGQERAREALRQWAGENGWSG